MFEPSAITEAWPASPGGPTAEPVTLAELRDHLRLDTSAEDTYLAALLTLARETAEKFCRRSFLSKVVTLKFDSFPECRTIRLPRSPVTGTPAVTYLDENGASQTLSTSLYTVDSASEPGRIVLNDGETWPDTASKPNAVTVTYGAGAATPPAGILHAIKLLAAHAYEHREPVITGTIVNELPFTVESLLLMHALPEA